MLTRYDSSSKTIRCDENLLLSQQVIQLTYKNLESCSLYTFDAVSTPLLTESVWQELLAFSGKAYVVFDNNEKLVTANLDPVNTDSIYLNQADINLQRTLKNGFNNKEHLLCLSEQDKVDVHVARHQINSGNQKFTAYVLSHQEQNQHIKQFEMLSKVVSNTSTSVLITDKMV